jgi:hypothetical protein
VAGSKLAPVRQRFMLAQVDAMGRELAALGIPLHLLRVETFAEVPTALTALCRELGVSQLYANQAIEIDELRRDHAVSAALGSRADQPLVQRLLRAARSGADRVGGDVQGLHPQPRLAQGSRGGWLRHSPCPRTARRAVAVAAPGRAGVGGRRAGI